MKFPYFEFDKIIAFIAFVMFYISIIIISGIDKEKRTINKSVLLFGILTQFAYILYLYILKDYNVYRYGMYLIIMCLLFIIDIFVIKKSGKSLYILQILMFLDYILMYISLRNFLIIMVLSFLYMFIYYIYKKVKFNFTDKPDILNAQEELKFGIGFCIGISSIIVVIVNKFILF